MSGQQPGTGGEISIDDVAAAVIAVGQIQRQIADVLEAVTRLTERVEALEAAQAPRA